MIRSKEDEKGNHSIQSTSATVGLYKQACMTQPASHQVGQRSATQTDRLLQMKTLNSRPTSYARKTHPHRQTDQTPAAIGFPSEKSNIGTENRKNHTPRRVTRCFGRDVVSCLSVFLSFIVCIDNILSKSKPKNEEGSRAVCLTELRICVKNMVDDLSSLL